MGNDSKEKWIAELADAELADAELADAEWLCGAVLNLFDFYGVEQFRRPQPILIRENYSHLRQESPKRYLTAIAEDMCRVAGIPLRRLIVDVYEEKKEADILNEMGIPYDSVGHSGTAGLFHHVDESGTARIAIEAHQLEDEISLAGTLAHELAHVFLHLQRPAKNERWPEEDEEHMTDVAAICLGFGVYICNSTERFRAYSDGLLSGWSTSTQGYLTLEEACYTQALVHNFFGQELAEYQTHLSANPRQLIKSAIPECQSVLAGIASRDAQVRRWWETGRKASAEPSRPIQSRLQTDSGENDVRRGAPFADSRAVERPAQSFRISRSIVSFGALVLAVLFDAFSAPFLPSGRLWPLFVLKGLVMAAALAWYHVMTNEHAERYGRRPNPPALVLRLGAHTFMLMALGLVVVAITEMGDTFASMSDGKFDGMGALLTVMVDGMLALGTVGYYGFVSGRSRM